MRLSLRSTSCFIGCVQLNRVSEDRIYEAEMGKASLIQGQGQ
jgi:hypothetical protein